MTEVVNLTRGVWAEFVLDNPPFNVVTTVVTRQLGRDDVHRRVVQDDLGADATGPVHQLGHDATPVKSAASPIGSAANSR